MKNGLYSVTAMGLDGVDWPPHRVLKVLHMPGSPGARALVHH
jgi:hypothetical protein